MQLIKTQIKLTKHVNMPKAAGNVSPGSPNQEWQPDRSPEPLTALSTTWPS